MTVGFIGAGNMGSALARAVYTTGSAKIQIFDKDTEKSHALARELCAEVKSSPAELFSECEAVFLGVKPNVVETVINEIREGARENRNTLLISMAAGVKLDLLSSLFGFDLPTVRIMPNTPVAVGCGMIAYSKNSSVTDELAELFLNILKNAGSLDLIDEELLDAETAVAGCGPAFAYMFIDALAKAGAKCGLSKKQALFYAATTVKGAAEMVLSCVDTPEELTKKVCSPGGSTIEGVNSLKADGLSSVVERAVKSSFEKTKILAKK